MQWKDGIVKRLTGGVGVLLKKNGVQVVNGWARIIDGKTVEVQQAGDDEPLRIGCEHLLLATGSQAVELPFMPFGGAVISATEALSPATLPKRLVVVGAGYIGLELGIAYRKLGARSDGGRSDGPHPAGLRRASCRSPVGAALKHLGVDVRLGTSVLGMNEGRRRRARARCGRRRNRSWRPIACWWRSAAGRAPKAGAWRACCST